LQNCEKLPTIGSRLR